MSHNKSSNVIEVSNKVSFSDLEKQYNKKFSKIIFSTPVLSKKIKLIDVLKKANVANPEPILQKFREIVEAKIYAQVEYYAAAQFTYMQRTGEWTEAGEDRVKLSFIRLVLNIPVSEEISFNDYSKFEEVIEKLQKLYKLADLNKDQLKNIINNLQIKVLDKDFDDNKTEDLNNILEIIGSGRRIMMGASTSFKSIIFGVAKTINYGKYFIHFFSKEEMRTPNSVHYIVAVIEKNSIAIRKEVCEYVFHNKWLPVFDNDMFKLESLSALDEENIAESIKTAVTSAFNVNSKEEFIEKKDIFLEIMMENLVYHELAHDAFEDSNINNTEILMANALSMHKENILSILTEVLTEWIPVKHDIRGPMKNMVETAIIKGNVLKAKQMAYIYMSDAWFLDTDTTFMYPYNFIMFSIILKYMNENKEIDFIAMHKDFEDIFNFLSSWYRKITTEVHTEITSMNYKFNGVNKSFKEIEDGIKKFMNVTEKLILKRTRDEKEKTGNFWINFFSQVAGNDTAALNHIMQFIQNKETDLYQDMMKHFATKEDNEKYKNDIKAYVLNKMKAVGFSLSHESA
ncbi:MAG: hypothetical protein PHV30_01940 [Candidatus Margulisbacteria bacterium]|nr:hypothetical protein [Candidatus Margulisiibacteriota bacterium]